MPLWTSALLPVASVAILYGVKRLAPALAGFAFGVAGYLLGRALLGSVDVAWIPAHGAADSAWLVANGLVAAAMGRVLLMRRN